MKDFHWRGCSEAVMFGTTWFGLKQEAAVWLLVLREPGHVDESNLRDQRKKNRDNVCATLWRLAKLLFQSLISRTHLVKKKEQQLSAHILSVRMVSEAGRERIHKEKKSAESNVFILLPQERERAQCRDMHQHWERFSVEIRTSTEGWGLWSFIGL